MTKYIKITNKEWNETPRDYKGIGKDGIKRIVKWVDKVGTCAVAVIIEG